MIDKLEFFIALSKHKHFGKAAESCGVTQPTLSSAIRQLEDQLGVVLVQRGSRYKGLTQEGQRVLEWSRRIVDDTKSMREEMRSARHGLSGHVRIASIPTASAMVHELTAPFIKKHPNITLSVTACSSIEVLSKIENFDIDVGITYLNDEPLSGKMVSLPLYAERFQLIVKAGSPLSERQDIAWSELGDIPLCLLTPDMQNRRIVNKHLEEAGVKVAPVLESNSMLVLYSHILNGDWASIIPVNIAELMGFGDSIRGIPIKNPDAKHIVGVVAARRDPNTPVVAALLREAQVLAKKNLIV